MIKENPYRIIIPTDDIVNEFTNRVNGILNPIDLNEILTQVFSMMLCDDSGIIEYGIDFPDLTMLVDTSFAADDMKVVRLGISVHWLITTLYDRLKHFGLFCDNDFPYYFEKLINYDIVLHHLNS